MTGSPEEVLAAVVRPGMRVVVGDGAGAPTHLLGPLTRVARDVGNISLLLGWCLDLPDDFDPSAFADVRTVMSGFALRGMVADGSVRYVPERWTAVPALLHGPLRPDVAILALRPVVGGWSWGSEVSWMRSLLDLPDIVVLVDENEGLPRASLAESVPRERGTVIARSARPPIDNPRRPPEDLHLRIAAHVAPYVPVGARLQYGPGPIADALAALIEVPVSVRSGMLTDAVLTLEQRGLLLGDPFGAYLWGTEALYDWADGRDVVGRVERTHVTALDDPAPVVTLNAALEVDHTGGVNVEALGPRAVSGLGGHPDFALTGHLSRRGVSIIATSTRRGSTSTLVERLSAPASTARSDVDIVVTELGAADLRGRSDGERREALLAIWTP
ncbi:acetyl-CoA hydrolase/transferase C-terminal domain-containing protein [Nocardioides zeae]|uniref:Acetyl-CoA hydrolase n=1 Tax=Nocardioides zeae TaxID=1457234 RepID=A0A6P0HQA5_9ACTN|nr:acetyl-CoA hydrolase/transferase C-terminal domain-containing protein [Nocardioides zeae]NEN79745.1 acetyl-CoA hydrolase [Nocardioides zeae]